MTKMIKTERAPGMGSYLYHQRTSSPYIYYVHMYYSGLNHGRVYGKLSDI